MVSFVELFNPDNR